ncbi:MAG: Bax inhibitor-1/YccA family protein [Proteobacteria bacterium]|nr:Bax inhibitor-1/YccA family protein [Pseudomonadota bacterium]MCL2306806.1 Bax inhibitor-1/YccA family protein [Pseudomonadota bacterium]
MDYRSPTSVATHTSETLRVAQQNRVLRNTYMLLALSLLPAIAGAWAGSMLNFVALYMRAPIAAPLLTIAVIIGAFFVVNLLRNSVWGIVALFVFTFIAGMMTTPILTYSAGFSNGAVLVALAAGMTATIFFVLASIASVSTRDFSFLGKFLFAGVILLLIAIVANLFFAIPALSLAISCVAVLIFSAYILYDVNRIVRGGETNYIMATLCLFVNIWILFTHLLNILLAFAGERD